MTFDVLYDKVTERFPKIEVVTVDAGYKTPWVCKKIMDDGRIPSMPYRYTPYQDLSQVTNWVRLKFVAMNLKKEIKMEV